MEQLGLERGMKVTDLVEEDRAAVGRLELADLELVGPGESASLVPEQLALQKLSGHRGAVDLDEWPGPAGGEVMDRACDELLAGSRLARDEHGDVDAGRLAEDLARLQHLGAGPELHLASDPSAQLLGSRAERLGLRANEIVDGLLKLVQVQRLVEHHVHLDRNGVETILAAGDDGDDGAGTPAVKLQTLDRKSTRLNSSHSQISYAVLFLKKKKNLTTQPLPVANDTGPYHFPHFAGRPRPHVLAQHFTHHLLEPNSHSHLLADSATYRLTT